MVRPRRLRRIFFRPGVTYFKPAGVLMNNLKEVVLSFEELEVIRLVDVEGMGQGDAGKKMKVSQSTLSRLLGSARKKLADAVVNGQAIKIEGGNFKMVQPSGRGFGRGRGLGGRMGGSLAAGPGGVCVCPKCGYKESQIRGQPCMGKKCTKCGALMVRG